MLVSSYLKTKFPTDSAMKFQSIGLKDASGSQFICKAKVNEILRAKPFQAQIIT